MIRCVAPTHAFVVCSCTTLSHPFRQVYVYPLILVCYGCSFETVTLVMAVSRWWPS